MVDIFTSIGKTFVSVFQMANNATFSQPSGIVVKAIPPPAQQPQNVVKVNDGITSDSYASVSGGLGHSAPGLYNWAAGSTGTVYIGQFFSSQ